MFLFVLLEIVKWLVSPCVYCVFSQLCIQLKYSQNNIAHSLIGSGLDRGRQLHVERWHPPPVLSFCQQIIRGFSINNWHLCDFFSPVLSQILKVTFLQRTPVMLHERLRKQRAWVYLREIISSLDDRRLMSFEWYRLRAAALLLTLRSLGWKHVV